jgi:hypothetical protein
MADRARVGLAAVTFALALIAAPAGLRAGGSDDALVEVTVHNAGPATLRCVTVLAHFVSLPAAEIAAGGALDVSYFRGAADGTLYVLRDDGRKMMIENLLCGSTDDWDATRGEVPLLPVRSSSADHMSFSCRIAARLACSEAT